MTPICCARRTVRSATDLFDCLAPDVGALYPATATEEAIL